MRFGKVRPLSRLYALDQVSRAIEEKLHPPSEEEFSERILGWVAGSTGGFYPIKQLGEGRLQCSCKGYEFRKKCRHLDAFARGEFVKENPNKSL